MSFGCESYAKKKSRGYLFTVGLSFCISNVADLVISVNTVGKSLCYCEGGHLYLFHPATIAKKNDKWPVSCMTKRHSTLKHTSKGYKVVNIFVFLKLFFFAMLFQYLTMCTTWGYTWLMFAAYLKSIWKSFLKYAISQALLIFQKRFPDAFSS